ncbi:MAG: hypothetical protein LBC94_08545 [Desulfovibrio sp.]|jgi:hypothetical protein|nr:hypothetical protein [Desulfovibrio sp.]
MPTQQETFQNSVAQVLEAVMFENWLRFYFITEKTEAAPAGNDPPPLFIAIPDKGMERIREDYAHLLPMAEALNGQEAGFEASRRAVCAFVLEHLDGKAIPKDTAGIVLESATFQTQLQLFNLWVQSHEAQLDENFLGFSAWRSLFAKWQQNTEVHSLAEKLLLSGGSPKETDKSLQ